MLDEWAEATGLKCNRNKTEGMRCGRLKRAGAHYTGPGSAGIQWVKRGCWIRTLGIPVGEDFREEDFLMDKYNKCRRLFSRWGPYIIQYITGFGT